MKYIGVSKHRLMAGRSKFCVVCNAELEHNHNRKPFPRNHLCVEHADWHLRVVDSQLRPDPHHIGERWEERAATD